MKLPNLFTKKNALFCAIGVGFLLIFFAFTLFVRTDALRSFDFDTTVKIQNRTPLKFDPFFSFLSVAGRFEYTIIILVSLLLIRRKIWAIGAIVFFGLAHVFELIGKTILNQPGPPHMFLRSQYSEFPGLYVHTDASYPSGHSLRIIFLCILSSYLLLSSKKLPVIVKLLCVSIIGVVTLFMIYSRVSLGEHWTTDVIGGTLLGTAFALFSLVLL